MRKLLRILLSPLWLIFFLCIILMYPLLEPEGELKDIPFSEYFSVNVEAIVEFIREG